MQLRGLAMPLVLGLALGGCDSEPGPEPAPEVASNAVAAELEDVVCELAMSCDCSFGRSFETAEECGVWAQTQQAEVYRLMDAYDLTWDPTCVGWYVKGFEDNGCADSESFTADPDGDDCYAPCMPLHGDKLAGQTCQSFEGKYSECGQGLYCDNGICAEYCPDPASAGESCQDRNCDDSSFCDVFETGVPTCKLKAAKGDDCSSSECGPGLRCVVDDPTAVMPTMQCKPLAKAAEACMGHLECETGYCPAGFCESIPEKGDSCRGTQICAEGLYCVEDVCGAAKKQGDSCVTSCGAGLQCLDGVCLGANALACHPGSPV